MTGLQLPQSQNAEESLLGSVFIDPSILPVLKVTPDQFYSHKNKWIWEAIQRLDSKGLAVDIVTVSDELERDGKLEEIGGPAYLTSLINVPPTSQNAEE